MELLLAMHFDAPRGAVSPQLPRERNESQMMRLDQSTERGRKRRGGRKKQRLIIDIMDARRSYAE